MSQWKRFSIGAAATAIVVETGARNLMLWTLVTVGTPLTTAVLVYEVVQLRQNHVERADPNPRATSAEQDAEAADAADADLRRHLSSMLVARARFVDLYAASPESISPVDAKRALDMLGDDERMFAALQAEKQKDLDGYLFDLQQDEARLRVLHAQVATLAAAAAAPHPSGPRALK